MGKILDRKYFRLGFIFCMFLNTLNLAYFGIGKSIIWIPIALWGIGIIAYDLFKKQLFFKNSHIGLIGMYSVVTLIATIMNKDYSDKTSYVLWFMQLLIFVLLFANKRNTTLINIKDEIRSIIPFTSILTLLTSGISLLMFFLNITSTANGVTIGLLGDRLFGVYFNCNPAAFLACIMMVFSLVAIKSKYKYTMVYYVNFCVQLMYIILSGCRTALIVVAFIAIAILYYKIFRKHGFSKMKQIIASLLVCICVLFGSTITQKVLYVIPQLQGASVEETGGRLQIDKIFEILSLIQEGSSANIHQIYNLIDEVSSGRLELLNTSYKVFKEKPLQGVGVNNFQRMGQVVNPKDGAIWQPQVVHTHNAFVESAVVGGIFGFFIFFLFFLRSCATIWNAFKKYTGYRSYFIVLCFMLVVASDFLGGMLDYGVFYTYSLSSGLAWLFLGYLYWLSDQPLQQLHSDAKYYDFMHYRLMSIQYVRQNQEILQDVQVKVLESHYNKKEYVVRVDVCLLYENQNAHFIYDVYFEIITFDEEKLNMFEEEMAQSLYEMVKEEIESLIGGNNRELVLV